MPQSLTLQEIMQILPHRYPFLLVDKILELDLEGGRIVGQKNLTINEAFFQGHFPEVPLMPGVLLIEAMAQTGGILVHLSGDRSKIAVLLSVTNAKFRAPAKPGDVLTLRAEKLHFSSRAGKIQASVHVGERLIAEAEISLAIVDKEAL